MYARISVIVINVDKINHLKILSHIEIQVKNTIRISI